MNRLPPSIPSGLHPDDIIPRDIKSEFDRHFFATFATRSTDDFLKVVKDLRLRTGVREMIARTYQELAVNGWHPIGIDVVDNHEEIKWAYRVSMPLPPDNLPRKMTADQSREYLNIKFKDIGLSF